MSSECRSCLLRLRLFLARCLQDRETLCFDLLAALLLFGADDVRFFEGGLCDERSVSECIGEVEESAITWSFVFAILIIVRTR